MSRGRLASEAKTELFVVRVADGQSVSLESVWAERRVALVFLRHLGCRFCKEQTDALVQSGLCRRLQEFNVTLAGVSLGSLKEAREWQKQTGFTGELYVDTTTSGAVSAQDQPGSLPYRAFRLKRGSQYVGQNAETQKRSDAVQAKFPDTAPKIEGEDTIYLGDVFQVGGCFVVGPGNCCDFSHRSRYAGDLLDLEAFEVAATGKRFNGEEYVYPSTEAWFSKLNASFVVKVKSISGVSFSAWRHCLQPLLTRYWRHATTMTALAFSARAMRREDISQSVAFLGLAGLVVGSACAFREKELIDRLSILTPQMVDEMVLRRGFPECDCAGAISNIEMDAVSNLARESSTSWTENEVDAQNTSEYQTMLCYFREFLAKPHPKVGRTGPVCPFVPKALMLDTVNLSVVRTSSIPKHQLRSTLTQLLVNFIPRFEAMEPTKGRQRQFKTIVFVFPDVALVDAHDVIDGAQSDAKPDFVSKGLMVGEFHAANNASGLRNVNFYPLRTPHPCLAIRHMVPGDLAFMTLDNYPKDLQRKFLESFLGVFGDDNKPETKNAKEQLANLG